MILFAKSLFFIFTCIVMIAMQHDNPKYDKVYVEWIDIIANEKGWHSKDEVSQWLLLEQDTVRQTGFLYSKTKTHTILIDSYFDEETIGGVTKIPNGCIIKIEVIK